MGLFYPVRVRSRWARAPRGGWGIELATLAAVEAALETASRRGSRLAHVPALDGLRGAAVAAVLAFHAGYLTGGYLGVDLFFVLSGYLITSLLVIEWSATGRISLRDFYARRLRRLLPALLVVLAAVAIVAHWEVLPAARDELRASGLATLAYVANWQAIFSGAGYWDRSVLPPWLDHTWSLAIEEQFYLLWPLVAIGVLGAHRFRSRRRIQPRNGPVAADASAQEAPGYRTRRRTIARLGRVAGGAALASGLAMVAWAWAGGDQQRLYLGTDTRAAAILLGCWAACRQQLRPPAAASGARRSLGRASLVATAVLALAWAALDGTDQLLYRGGLLACGVAATVIILDVTSPGPSVVGRALEVAPLRGLGAISYGLYLWHWPIFQFLYPGRYGLDGASLLVARVAASLVAAQVSYALIEQPIRHVRPPAKRWLPAFTPVAVGLCVIALLVGTAGGLDVAPDTTRSTISATGPVGTPKMMVVGDSVAHGLAQDGLIPQASNLGLNVDNRAVIGCTLMLEVGHPLDLNRRIGNCSPQWPGDVERVRPDIVLVLFGAYTGVLPAPVDGVDSWPCEKAWDRRWERELNRGVDVLGADGATVVLSTAPTAGLRAFKGRDAGLFDRRQACSNAVLRHVARRRGEAELLDLARLICPKGRCRTTLDGVTLRVDGLHFVDDAALAVTARIGPELTRLAARR